MDDREWDIFMVEVETRNIALIEEFMMDKMRPRDLAALEAQSQPQQPQQIQEGPEELNAIAG